MFAEEQQRKRKTDGSTAENEALEKKQRVEQLVTALSKGERRTSYSSETGNEKMVSFQTVLRFNSRYVVEKVFKIL